MTTLVSDTFTAADGTTLSGRTPSPTTAGNNWVVASGTWLIESNTVQNTVDSGDVQATVDCGQADVAYMCDFISPSSSWNGGLIANFVDTNNFWLYDFGTISGNSSIYEKASGSYTQRANTALGDLPATTYNLQIITAGDTITCYKNGTSVMTYNVAGRSSKTATKFGFRRDSAGGVTPSWDNFLVSGTGAASLGWLPQYIDMPRPNLRRQVDFTFEPINRLNFKVSWQPEFIDQIHLNRVLQKDFVSGPPVAKIINIISWQPEFVDAVKKIPLIQKDFVFNKIIPLNFPLRWLPQYINMPNKPKVKGESVFMPPWPLHLPIAWLPQYQNLIKYISTKDTNTPLNAASIKSITVIGWFPDYPSGIQQPDSLLTGGYFGPVFQVTAASGQIFFFCPDDLGAFIAT